MAFEIVFTFHPKKEEGSGYNTEKTDTLTIKVGKQYEDIELDEVAKTVFGQLAKRNVLIIDAQIYEYKKSRVNFKMKDDGIVIKNKKFSYDITGAIKSANEEEIPLAQPVTHPHEVLVANPVVKHPHELLKENSLPPEVQAEIAQFRAKKVELVKPASVPTTTRAPVRYEVYDPDPELLREARATNLPFTIGKRYPIFEEKPAPGGVMQGMLYLTEDDKGVKRAISDKFFVLPPNLTAGFIEENSLPRQQQKPRLMYEGRNGEGPNLPDIFTLGRKR